MLERCANVECISRELMNKLDRLTFIRFGLKRNERLVVYLEVVLLIVYCLNFGELFSVRRVEFVNVFCEFFGCGSIKVRFVVNVCFFCMVCFNLKYL